MYVVLVVVVVDTPQLDPVRGLRHFLGYISQPPTGVDTPQLDPVRGLRHARQHSHRCCRTGDTPQLDPVRGLRHLLPLPLLRGAARHTAVGPG